MKDKNGFTIIELMISVSILAVIVVLSVINFNKVFDKSESESYIDFTNKVKSAADLYLSNNQSIISELNSNKGYVRVSLKVLKEEGFISKDLINPETKKTASDDETVLVSLDETGLYKFTYPDIVMEEYLQTINKIINYGDNYDCLSEIDSINLGLIDKDGNLLKDYFKNNPEYISCSNNEIDTTKIGHYVIKYSYTNTLGIKKEASRNFIVIDHINPSVSNVEYSPKSWTNGNVLIKAFIEDKESGIAAHSISLGGCNNFVNSSKSNIEKSVSENGLYSICAKDVFGNVTESTVKVDNIDKKKPDITVSKSTSSYVTSLTISASLTDNDSMISAYAINTSSNQNNVSWTNITPVKTKTISHNVTSNGTYYVWAKDAAGNIDYKSIVINNIGTLKSATFNTNELTSAYFPSSYNTGATVKGIVSVGTNTGSVLSSSYSGTSVYFTLSNGSAYTGTGTTTCSKSASYTSKILDSYCSSYSCPSGGYYNYSGMCTGSDTDPKEGANYYICENREWQYNGATYNVRCEAGYTKWYYCDPISNPCNGASTKTITCTGGCLWNGDYRATCSGYSNYYYCPSGYSEYGSGCYKCSYGESLSGSTCYYSCPYNYTYYRYTVTIQYII